MPAGDIRLRIDHAAMRATVAPLAEAAVVKAAAVSQRRASENVYGAGLVNSGRLAESFQMKLIGTDPMFPRAAVGSPLHYVKYPEYGTRAHGPVKANALRFIPKGGKGFVYAKWVRGVRPYGFMKLTLDQVRPTDFE